MPTQWYERTYRRSVIDMHITADDPGFLSQLDPAHYVEMLRVAQAQSTVLYGRSHVGLCLYPTALGEMHPGLHGRDTLAELLGLCREHHIGVALYFSLIFDNWSYDHDPDWRIVNANGRQAGEGSRYGVCCPNSPYRDFVAALVEEVCGRYDFEGMRFDMTFWPTVCYCRHCGARFAREVGGELPRVVNWEDPRWVAFQRKREEWLADFAALQTATVRRCKPAASVEHQASTYAHSWRLGVTTKLVPQNDFLQGDFYGDAVQGSFARKLFYNLSPNRPGGFETSIAVELRNYTTLKSPELLACKAHAALADASAFVFIDSIDPVGTLNEAVYERMGRVFAETSAYEPYVGGELRQDIAVYLSTESKFDPADNGKAVDDPHASPQLPHVEAAVSATRSLLEHHLPFGVITRRNLGQLARHKVVVLPNVLMMDREEAEAIRAYVGAGGNVYASRFTSLTTPDGRRQDDFLLGDVLGAAYRGETRERFTYIAPAVDSAGSISPAELFGDYSVRYPLGMPVSQVRIERLPGAVTLGELVLPYSDPADPRHFSSIHNDPPGVYTGQPAMLLNRYGEGKAIYCAFEIETFDPARAFFIRLLRLLAGPLSFEADAPKPVEMTLFDQPDRARWIISLLNFQKDLPNIPVEAVRVRVRLEGRTPRRLLVLPGETELVYEEQEGYAQFTAPRLDTFLMFALEYDAAR